MIKIASRFFLLAAGVVSIVVVFIVDVLTPRGIEIWVFYLPIILAMVFSNSQRLIVHTSMICTMLVVLGRYWSPPALNPDWWDLLNRAMGIMAIWLTACAGLAISVRSKQLATLYQELFVEVEARKQTGQLLRESEERMRLAMESGGLGTRDVNLKTSLEIWSDTHFRICGYEPTASGTAQSEMLDRLIHSDDLGRVLAARQDARAQRALYHVEYRLRRADNQKLIWVEVWGRYHYDSRGEAIRFVGICFDISRRKELERKELEREILEITSTQQQIIGQDLHDGLGQELTGLGLMAQTLVQLLPEDSLGNRISNRLIVGIGHTHRIVRDLSRGLVAIEVDARGLPAAVKELAKWTTENTDIAVMVTFPTHFEMPDQTTATHVFRIIQEAVSNALRHGQPGQIQVTMQTASSGLRLTIQDDGVGLDEKAEAKQGLGLRIMKYRAGLIGGVVRIDSAARAGTLVTLTLPWRNSDDDRATEG